MDLLLALLFWLFSGFGIPASPATPPGQTIQNHQELVPGTRQSSGFERVERISPRHTIIVLDDTQFRPAKR